MNNEHFKLDRSPEPQLEFKSPKVPERFVVDPFDSAVIEEHRTEFFLSVLDSLHMTQLEIAHFATIEPFELHKPSPTGGNVTNDRVTGLIVRDFLAASVYERRTEQNMIEVAFAHYLTQEKFTNVRKGLLPTTQSE